MLKRYLPGLGSWGMLEQDGSGRLENVGAFHSLCAPVLSSRELLKEPSRRHVDIGACRRQCDALGARKAVQRPVDAPVKGKSALLHMCWSGVVSARIISSMLRTAPSEPVGNCCRACCSSQAMPFPEPVHHDVERSASSVTDYVKCCVMTGRSS